MIEVSTDQLDTSNEGRTIGRRGEGEVESSRKRVGLQNKQ